MKEQDKTGGTFIIIGGRPGAGKTTLAKEITKQLRCVLIMRDAVFHKLFRKPNPHSVEHKIKAFEECIRLSGNSLKKKEVVILEMPFSRNAEIENAFGLAKEQSSKWRFVYLECPDKVADERIRRQKKHLVKPELRINTRTEKLPKRIPISVFDTTGHLETYLGGVMSYISN